ncbi:hypothetical protein [Sphingomonas sp.]|uniref:hypothetical protein n=1 Tax=Sphingomonas sp. TaxID=28214 RepID=UPI002DD6A831|nr:hypothetical protein [Sphingomonas sp.]
MHRASHIFLVIAFVVSGVFAAPFSVCRHADAQAHAMALASTDASEALVAQLENEADAAAKKHGSLADFAAATLSAILVPNDQALATRAITRAVAWFVAAPASLIGRSSPPLLEPPLG